MKHEVTTYQTKKMLSESLKTAMKSKAFSKITVSEIIADCGVNRKTFYYHFEDIFALLRWMFAQETAELVKYYDRMADYEEIIHFVVDYVDKNDHFINCAFDSLGRDELKRFFYKDFLGLVNAVIEAAEEKYQKKLEPDFKEYAARFYTEALSGMLIDLVKEKQERAKAVGYLKRILDAALESIGRFLQ